MKQDVAFLPRAGLQDLLQHLQARGYHCIGPTVRDGAIVYEELHTVGQLPRGVQEQQAPGVYRLQDSDSDRYFSWANGPQALKPLTFAPREVLWQCQRDAEGKLTFVAQDGDPPATAVIGVRACDIAALYIHDRHFLQQEHRDPYYLARRQKLFIVAVNCTHPADTCFCASTGDGPRAHYGYDLALTELAEGFVIESHTAEGKQLASELSLKDVTEQQLHRADELLQSAATNQSRQLPPGNLFSQLFDRLEHDRWDEVARRCLGCGNCTAVCPTCFCHSETEQPRLDGSGSTHIREWDSCFSPGHSYIHGLTIRDNNRNRYRQWLTHKLGSWHEQYGRSGCVGCGRCISWCPVGIDPTEEIAAILETNGDTKGQTSGEDTS